MQKIGFCERYMLTTAVLERLKINTRRLEKALERVVADYEKQYGEPFEIINQYWDEKRKKVCCLTKQGIIHVGTHYKLNDVVAVAQSYKDVINTGYDLIEKRNLREKLENELGLITLEYAKGWNNKLFVKPELMPHWVQITGVRIERLQDITDEDCLKEGVICETFDDGEPLCYKVLGIYDKPKSLLLKEFMTPREAFAALINRPGVGRKGLWESNPFVVVYEFKLIK